MGARGVYRLLDVHSEINHIHQYLKNGVDYCGSARASQHQEEIPFLFHQGRSHGAQGALARFNLIGDDGELPPVEQVDLLAQPLDGVGKVQIDAVVQLAYAVAGIECDVLVCGNKKDARAEVIKAEARLESARSELEKARQALGAEGESNPKIRSAMASLKQAQIDLCIMRA